MTLNSQARCAAAMPSGTPIAIDTPAEATTSAKRLDRLLPEAEIDDEEESDRDGDGKLPGALQILGERARCAMTDDDRRDHQHKVDQALERDR